MIPNRVRVSQHATRRLTFLKSQTGLTPNILSRIAFMLAIRDMRRVPQLAEDMSGQEFNAPTLFGEYQEVYDLLLTKYFHETMDDGDPNTVISHLIENGLHKMGHIRSLEDVVRLNSQPKS
ncbi:MAG: DndE family protein [Gammaproteobacteria bacterium]|nr:DndE family protein [Gammaproteobacteria bacterium]